MDLQQLRSMRNKKTLSEIQAQIASQNTQKTESKKDERFWNVERDAAGNGSAVIRFLPKLDADELHWVRIFKHSFKGPTGKWYIENSLSTIGKPDPVGDKNSELWNSGIEANKNIARNQKRKLTYVCNVLVVKDPKHPENEGQVKLFSFGKKIFDMISDKVNPKFEDDEAVDVFGIDDGVNFRLRVVEGEGGWPNYDKSDFAAPSVLCDGNEERMLEVLNSRHLLSELISPDKFKSYEDLKKRFDFVMKGSPSTTASEDVNEEFESKPEPKKSPVKEEKPVVAKKVQKIEEEDDEDDEDISYFKKNVKKSKEDSAPF
jgi:hypothetical protein